MIQRLPGPYPNYAALSELLGYSFKSCTGPWKWLKPLSYRLVHNFKPYLRHLDTACCIDAWYLTAINMAAAMDVITCKIPAALHTFWTEQKLSMYKSMYTVRTFCLCVLFACLSVKKHHRNSFCHCSPPIGMNVQGHTQVFAVLLNNKSIFWVGASKKCGQSRYCWIAPKWNTSYGCVFKHMTTTVWYTYSLNNQ